VRLGAAGRGFGAGPAVAAGVCAGAVSAVAGTLGAGAGAVVGAGADPGAGVEVWRIGEVVGAGMFHCAVHGCPTCTGPDPLAITPGLQGCPAGPLSAELAAGFASALVATVSEGAAR
jgi:hypothetical protein